MAINFASYITYGAGQGPIGAVAVDVNGDGITDIVAADLNGVSVLLGKGGGSFAPASTTVLSPLILGIAVTDMNGDGTPDVVLSQRAANSAADVLLGDGKGGFLPETRVAYAQSPYALAVGDLNGDGLPDIVEAVQYGVAIFLTNAGQYDPGARITTPDIAYDAALADMNGDGRLDLVVAGGASTSIRLGDGHGGFSAATSYPVDGLYMAIADMNGDGVPDIIVADERQVDVMLGDGKEGVASSLVYPMNSYVIDLAAADLDGDGHVDVIVSDFNGHETVLPGLGDGTFGAPIEFETPPNPEYVSVGDVNGDGKPDLLVGGQDGHLSVLLNAPPTDTLTLRIAEDAWRGDAQFTVSVDGVQDGGIRTAHALHASGASDVLSLSGNWGAGPHDVQITFLNDAWGGAKAEDRNLYVTSIAYNGTTYAGTSALMAHAGSQEIVVGETAPAAARIDTVTLHLSEDAWLGDAQFTVMMDGRQIATAQPVTAQRADGDWQDISFSGDFGAGEHEMELDFVNDAFGGKAGLDRNLYVDGLTVDGQDIYRNVFPLTHDGGVGFNFTIAH